MKKYYFQVILLLFVILYFSPPKVEGLLRKCCPLNTEFSFLTIEQQQFISSSVDNRTGELPVSFVKNNDYSIDIVLNSDDTFKCVLSAANATNRLTTIWFDSLIIGFPQCTTTAYRIISRLHNSKLISCLDKHYETGLIIGLQCVAEDSSSSSSSSSSSKTSTDTIYSSAGIAATTTDETEVSLLVDRPMMYREPDGTYSWIGQTEPAAAAATAEVSRPTKLAQPIVSLRKCCDATRSYDVEKQFCWSRYGSTTNTVSGGTFNSNNHIINDTVSKLIKLTVKKNQESFVNVSFGVPNCDYTTQVLTDRIVSYRRIAVQKTDSVTIELSSTENRAENMVLAFGDYCVDMIDDIFEYVVVRYCEDYQAACKQRANLCLRKCCPSEQMLKGSKQCGPSKVPLDLAFYHIPAVADNDRDPTPVVGRRPSYAYGLSCKKYPLKPTVNPKDQYYLTDRGNVYLPHTKDMLGDGEFCVEYVDIPGLEMNGTYVFACFPPVRQETRLVMIKHAAVFVLSILSSVFLFLTFLVYTCLPSLQNLHGKTVMCYVATLFLGYVVLSIIYLPVFNYATLCISLGYTMLFTFLSAFCWMNVICYDIWSTFGAVKSAFVKKSGTRTRFIFYRAYGWGVPLIWTAVTFACQFSSLIDEDSVYKPDIRKSSCWFDDYGRSRIVFFIVPVSIMIVCNTFLFTMTVIYCSKVRNAINNVRDNEYVKKKFIRDKNKLIMNTKLFVAMGINWIIEMISLTVCPEQRIFFLISDLLNASVGILIFIIFVVKKKIINSLKNKLSTKSTDTVCSNIGLRPTFSTSVFNNSMASSTVGSPCRTKV